MNNITKNRTLLVLAVLLLSAGGVFGQAFQGIATYKTAASIDLQLDSSQALQGIDHSAIQQQLQKALQREYELRFTVYESTYKPLESLEAGPTGGSGIMVNVSGRRGLVYKNTKDQQLVESTDVFGKLFLIEDDLERIEWRLEDEYKQIGEYECQKAVYDRVVNRVQFSPALDEEPKTVTDTTEVVAWFTPEVPVSHGPGQYWGLPGLILEVRSGRTAMICTKIILNPAEEVDIDKPTRGKSITREELQQLREKKLKEMQDKYKGNDAAAGRIMIRTGD